MGRFLRMLFILVVFAPTAMLVVGAIVSPPGSLTDVAALVVPNGRRLALFVRSVGLALAVALAGMTLGVLTGTFLWRWRRGVGVYLRWFFLLMLVLPPYVHKQVWASTFETLTAGGMIEAGLASWLAAWWVQLMAFAPIAVGLTLVGMQSIDPERIDASRMLVGDDRTLLAVVLPLAAPAILAAGGIVFLLSLTDYSIPSLCGRNVYALDIHADYMAGFDPSRTLLLAAPLLVVTVAVAVLSQSRLRRASLKPTVRRSAWALPPRWPAWLKPLQIAAALVLAGQLVVPLVALATATGGLRNFLGNVHSARTELGHTLWVCGVTAVLALPPAFAAAKRLARSDRWGKWWWVLVAAPLAVPAPLVGIGLVVLFNRDIFGGLYRSPYMLVLATLARFMPIAAIVILAQLRRIDRELLDAARVFQRGRLNGWLRVHVPLMAPGVLAAACIVFALSAGELGATQMITAPGYQTLTPMIYNYMHHGSSRVVASLCLLMTLTTLSAGVLAAVTFRMSTRLLARRRPRRP